MFTRDLNFEPRVWRVEGSPAARDQFHVLGLDGQEWGNVNRTEHVERDWNMDADSRRVAGGGIFMLKMF